MSPIVPWSLAIVVTSIAAVSDARTGRIPNWLNAAGFLAAIGLHVFHGIASLRLAALGFIVSGFVPGTLYLASRGQALGGGDVKLFAVLGTTLGPFSGLEVQLLSYSLLLVFALCKLSYQGELLRMLRNAAGLLIRRVMRKRGVAPDPQRLMAMRLGPAIFGAALLLALRAHLGWLAL